jgi:lon-related putative ATP-dependent protease
LKKSIKPLKAEQVSKICSPVTFDFETTADLEVLEGVIEQERAVRSLKTGLSINRRNYNVYVAGISGTGRTTIVQAILSQIAADRPSPPDWVYVYNFKDKEAPCAIQMPAGKGRAFAEDMGRLVEALQGELPAAFRDKEYQAEVQDIVSESLSAEHDHFATLSKRAEEVGFAVKSTKTGLVTVPMAEGKSLSNKEYDALSEDEKKTIEERRRALEPYIHDFVSRTRVIETKTQDRIKRKQMQLARRVSSKPIRRLKRRYGKIAGVREYLGQVQAHLLDSLGQFVRDEGPGEGDADVPEREFIEYKVNVVVDNSEGSGAPIIVEPRPTYYNLFGKIEKRVENGVYFTDFTMIKAGSVLKANGGYLLINTNDLFSYPLVWENLKSILRYREATIEDLGEHMGYLPTSGLKPQPIPINLKIVLVGPGYVYELLHRNDEDFRKLFQVKSEFDYEMPRNEQTMQDYARFVATTCSNEKLRPVTSDGVSAVVEYGSRLVESQRKVTLQFNLIANLLVEADAIAEEEGAGEISRSHVEDSIRQREYRLSLLEEKVREDILENSVLIDSEGEGVGAVNGLAVYEIGDYLFGKPSRITASVYAGKGGIINVEREARLSGNLHAKGVLIISGFLGRTFAQKRSLSLTVSICFEQSYGYVDGDSASSTELFAILSALADVPIKQGFAVTGSVNQHGEIQPIGGVNEKIEAWFLLCKERGLTGEQGVVIPHANIVNLMLKEEVVEAVRNGQFHVYPISRVEEGIEILTGMAAGVRDADFDFAPEQTVFARADATLQRYEEAEAGAPVEDDEA